jgi:2-polyprenyl-3-methyl-5-hydroxy-6-metoxy-1,4-benzoquinol methylase
MKKDASFYDVEYFGYTESSNKSNYNSLGGYKDVHAKAEYVVDLITLEIPKACKVLEIGCAHGATIREFRSRGIQCYGIDCSEYIVSIAANDIKDYIFLADMHNLPKEVIDLKPFDVVYSKDVLEHTDSNSINSLITNLGAICSIQFHIINTGEYEHQLAHNDESHSLLRPLHWWVLKFESLNLNAILKSS